MSGISRHFPVIALTIIFGISMYFVYTNLNRISYRIENLSQELFYGMNSVTEIAAKIDDKQVSPSLHYQPVSPKSSGGRPFPQSNIGNEEAQDARSVASADIIISSGLGSLINDAERRSVKSPAKPIYDRPIISEIDDSADADIESYIDNLEDKFLNKNPKDIQPDDDVASIGSQISSVNAMSNKKKVPPFAANQFRIGWLQKYNGKLYEVIRTKGERSAVRWGKAQPIPADWNGNPEEQTDITPDSPEEIPSSAE